MDFDLLVYGRRVPRWVVRALGIGVVERETVYSYGPDEAVPMDVSAGLPTPKAWPVYRERLLLWGHVPTPWARTDRSPWRIELA